MTPEAVEARLTGQPDSATVAAVLDELRDDPDWTITEVTVNGRLVHVELVHEPTGTAYTLRTQSQQHAGARAPDADTPAE